jgi:hypothetical protein
MICAVVPLIPIMIREIFKEWVLIIFLMQRIGEAFASRI